MHSQDVSLILNGKLWVYDRTMRRDEVNNGRFVGRQTPVLWQYDTGGEDETALVTIAVTCNHFLC